MRQVALRVVVISGCVLVAACGARSRSAQDLRASGTRAAPAASAGAAAATASRPGAAAADTGGAEVFSAELLRQRADRLGTATGETIGSTATRKYMVGRRVASGGPEVHDRWTDLAYVQAGRATLVSGGRVEGGKDDSPGEHRGGTIVGGTSRVLGPGDLIIIPAGMPHQYVLAAGDTLRYLTLKVLEGPR